jgi:uncharacterized membrane protein
MAIDPDMQPLLDALDARIAALETASPVENHAYRDALARYHQRFYAAIEGKTEAEVIAILDGVGF